MAPKNIYDIVGTISDIFRDGNSAEICFVTEDSKYDYALLKKGRFYYNGKLIPEDDKLSKYLSVGTKVYFSCHPLVPDQKQNEYHLYPWFAMICWTNEDESFMKSVTRCTGLVSAAGTIERMTKRRGVLTVVGQNGEEYQRVSFLASKVYKYGKRFSATKMLDTEFHKGEIVFLDAMPCIPQEDRDHCSWFATCVYQGKRPDCLKAEGGNKFMVKEDIAGGVPASNWRMNGACARNEESAKGTMSHKALLLKEIQWHTSNPRTLFSIGHGHIMEILNDEFGLILGTFRKNNFQTILFHRKNAFLFTVSLARVKLTEVFKEGDRMHFVAVPASSNVPDIPWIAVQVAVDHEMYDLQQ